MGLASILADASPHARKQAGFLPARESLLPHPQAGCRAYPDPRLGGQDDEGGCGAWRSIR
jgi:hypothetical protein